MSTAQSSPVDLAYAIVALLIEKPRTRKELCELLGIHENTASYHLNVAKSEGLITVSRADMPGVHELQRPHVFTWAPEKTGSAQIANPCSVQRLPQARAQRR